MIAIKESATPRLEVEFKLLVGELRVMEDDFIRMPLPQFLEVWGPEVTNSKLIITLITKEKEDGKRDRSRRSSAPVQQELFPTDNGEIQHG